MSEIERRFHETWLGMVQPVEGLVVSIPVLLDAQCMERQPPSVQATFVALCPPQRSTEAGAAGHTLGSLRALLETLLGYPPNAFDDADALPEALSLWVPEGRQTLRPTLALRKPQHLTAPEGAETTPASRAGAAYEMFVWQLPTGLDLDRPETVTGSWDYPPAAKFDRLLRHCRVPIGLLVNDVCARLVYAPHGESSGSITFRFDDMASVGGRPILDAFVMLLGANRLLGVEPARALPAILSESRRRQANVTNTLALQVFDALQRLLQGFQAAAERDGRALLDDALAREGDALYKGLLTVLLRLVFVLYAEDRGLLPVEHPLYAQHYSVLALFEQLQRERDAWPDSMSRRFGAYGRLVATFRAIYLGVDHGDLHMPPRRGDLFDPHRFPFLEGWGPAGSAPIAQPDARAAVRVPTVDDETVLHVLEGLLVLDGQRLSYRALDVEQIGSVYEGLMGYHVQRVPAEAVCLRPDRVWVTADEVLAVAPAQRAKWIKETVGLANAQADKLATELSAAETSAVRLDALAKFAAGGRGSDPATQRARPGQLVLQPGTERRRTSSHYTPRSLSAPIVRRTLQPLLAVMGEAPPSAQILALKVCDPAMGSGAFLVEACRFLADHVVAAWTREGALEAVAHQHGDPLLHARRLVAQQCLYGVDKNDAAVELAKLSLWLVTLARDLPFTFVDHALRHGDSLVGLDFAQIGSFHWKPGPQQELFAREVRNALDEAIALRERILALAASPRPADQREKERLLWDAEDAMARVRLVADLVVGAFFAADKDKARETERARRLDLVVRWFQGEHGVRDELVAMQLALRGRVPAFHWHLEFPEVFYAERPDPLDGMRVNGAAYMDAFVGNPPFLGGSNISGEISDSYLAWIVENTKNANGKADICAYFFRRAHDLIGMSGTIGLIATNTISQGETRLSGLRPIILSGTRVFDVHTDLQWPGEANVVVSIVCLAKGTIAVDIRPVLDGREVGCINSLLKPLSERDEAVPLEPNRRLSSKGVDISGQGFLVSPDEKEIVVRSDERNAERIFEYVGGEDVNTSPIQSSRRFIISFEGMTLEEAAVWPDLLRIVEQRVRVDRAGLRATPINNRLKELWWRYWADRPDFMKQVRALTRCLVTARVTKHLCFSFQPQGRVLNEKLVIFCLDRYSQFAVLQSRVHNFWSWLLSSTMKLDLSYTPSDCFETFPFPQPDPRAVIPELEVVGEALYTARAQYMVDENVGLTVTYNRLKDPGCTEARVVALRAQHEAMDRAVLRAYGWDDLAERVPPFCVATEADTRALAAFEAAVIDRLFALNAARAEAERLAGLGVAPAKGAKGGGEKKARGKKAQAAPQLSLLGGGDGDGEA